MRSYVQTRVLTEDAKKTVDGVASAIRAPSGFKKSVAPGSWSVRGIKTTPGSKVVTLENDDIAIHVNLSMGPAAIEAIGNTLFKTDDGWALLRGRGASESFYSNEPSDLNYIIQKQIQMAERSVGESVDEAKPPLGSGQRFRALSKKLSKQKGVKDPDALAAVIGRKKYGPKRFAKLSAKGR